MKIESAVYKPFGEQSEWLSPSQTAPETKGWIGERYDADAGLQYLNAGHYDPVLGMFIQADWFEVTMPGVGTNRYAYCGRNPVNCLDPGGNSAWSDFTDSLRDSWDAFKDAVNGRATHVDNAGQNGTGGSYGYARVEGQTYGCFGCQGTGEKAASTVERAMRFANRGSITLSTEGGPGPYNRHQIGVEAAISWLTAKRYEILIAGPARVIVAGFGSPRVYDLLAEDFYTGQVVGVEVKTSVYGEVTLIPEQVLKDAAVLGGAVAYEAMTGLIVSEVIYMPMCYGCEAITKIQSEALYATLRFGGAIFNYEAQNLMK